MEKIRRFSILTLVFGVGGILLPGFYPKAWADQAALQFQLGSQAFREGRKEAALQEYEYFLKRFPNHPRLAKAQFMIGEILFQSRKFALAQDAYLKVLSRSAQDDEIAMEASYRLGECYYNLRDFDEAAFYFSKVKKSRNRTLQGEGLYGLAMTELARGKYEQVEAAFLELMASQPAYAKQPKVLIPLGLAALDKGDVRGALQQFERGGPDLGCRYYQGICYLKSGEVGRAMEFFKSVTEKDPSGLWGLKAHYQLGECFITLKEYGLARAAFQKIIDRGKNGELVPAALYRLACIDYRQKLLTAAENKWQQLVSQYSQSPLVPQARFMIAQTHLSQKNYAKALEQLQPLLEFSPLAMDVYYSMVWTYAQLGQYEKALTASTNFLNRYSWGILSAKTLLVQGFSYQKSGRLEEAIKSYQKILDRYASVPFGGQVVYLMIRTHFEAKSYDRIVTQSYPLAKEMMTATGSPQAEIYYWAARSYQALEQYDQAQKLYTLIAENFPNSKLLPSALQGISVCLASSNNDAQALESEKKTLAVAARSGSPEVAKTALLNLAKLHFNRQEYAKASAYYEQFGERYRQDEAVPEALYYQGLALARSEATRSAIKTWEQLPAKFPQHPLAPQAQLQIAKTHFGLGDYLSAMTSYQLVVNRYPKTDFAHEAAFQIGQCYFNQGNLTAAISQFKEFLQKYPDDSRSQDARKQMEICYYRLGKKTNDFKALLTAFPGSPLMADVYWEKGSEAFNKKDYATAQSYFQKLILHFPNTSLGAKAFFYQAESHYSQKHFEQALQGYDNFVRSYPTDPLAKQAAFRLAMCHFDMEQYQQSVQLFTEFLNNYPEDPLAREAFLNIAIGSEKLNRPQESLEAYERFLARYPRDPQAPEALFSAARCYEKLNKPLEQKKAYEQLVLIAPGNDPYRLAALAWLANRYEQNGDIAKSLSSYREIVKHSQDQEVIRMSQEKIKILQGVTQ